MTRHRKRPPVRRRADEPADQPAPPSPPPPLPSLPADQSSPRRARPQPQADWSTAARAEAAPTAPQTRGRAARRAAERAQPEPQARAAGRTGNRAARPAGSRTATPAGGRAASPGTGGRAARRAAERTARRRRPPRRTIAQRLGLPERKPDPEPFEGNAVRVVSVGTAAWLVAFVVLLPNYDRLLTAGRGWWLWTCLAGFGLGLWGIHITRRRRAALPARVRDPSTPAGRGFRPPRRRSASAR